MGQKIIDGVCEITWKRCERIGSFIKTTLIISPTNPVINPWDITHYWYTEWPDHDVPMTENQYDTNSIYEMLMDIIAQQETDSVQSPLLVHCSAGVGRTGTIIGCHHAMTTVNTATPEPETADKIAEHILRLMRKDRCMLIQVIAQFKLFYKYIVDYYKILSDAELGTQPEKKPVPNRYMRRMASVKPVDRPGVTIDHKYIQFQQTNPFYTPPIDYFKEYFYDQYDAFTALEKIRSIKYIKNTDIMEINLTDIFGLGEDGDSEVKIRTGFNTVMDSETADNKFIWSLRRQKNREHSAGRGKVSIKTGSSFMTLGGKAEECRIEGVKAYDFYLEYKSSDTVESANNTDPCEKKREFKDYYYEVNDAGDCIRENIVSTNVVIANSAIDLEKYHGFDISKYKLAQYGCFHIGTYKDCRDVPVARVIATGKPITINTTKQQKKLPKDIREMCENINCLPSYQSVGKLSQELSDDIKQALIMISAAHNQDYVNVGSRAHAKSFENIQAFFYSKKNLKVIKKQ